MNDPYHSDYLHFAVGYLLPIYPSVDPHLLALFAMRVIRRRMHGDHEFDFFEALETELKAALGPIEKILCPDTPLSNHVVRTSQGHSGRILHAWHEEV